MGTYIRLTEIKDAEEKKIAFLEAVAEKNHSLRFNTNEEHFSKIPGSPIAYWWHNFSIFEFQNISIYYESAGRNKTHGNELYVRNWWEINNRDRWQPYANGGEFRRWAGNDFDLVDWSVDARNNYASHGGLYNQKFAGRQGICWNLITSYKNGFRIKHFDHHYSSGAPTIIANEQSNFDDYVLAYLNGCVAETLLKIYNPSLNTTVGDVLRLPIKIQNKESVDRLSIDSRRISQTDWDSFETSWDFTRHPLVRKCSLISEAFEQWEQECAERFQQLKTNEEELNRIFIDLYGLSDELSPEVANKDVSVALADKTRDIKSFLSYAVGCLFGRYSLDCEGLAYAGGNWDDSRYETVSPDDDNIIPIMDEDYFSDDLTKRFIDFVSTLYGAETLEKNLDFIADALGRRGNARDVIRNYFLNDFYKDHLKIYKKRPIYWLFSSGRENGFKALIYLHRYHPDIVSKMRIDYLHRAQSIYEREIARTELELDSNPSSSTTRRRGEKLRKQLAEAREYDKKIETLANARIALDLDDGVKVNYEKLQTVDRQKLSVLEKIS